MLKITGLDGLKRQLEAAEAALKVLDGELGAVSFDSRDPASIEQAIQTMEFMVDEKISGLERGGLIDSLAVQLKEKCRELIVQKAATARLFAEGEE